MKKNVLLLAIGLLPLGAAAQMSVANYVTGGANAVLLAKRLHNSNKAKAEAPLAHFRVGNRSIPQKRTPPDQIHGRANDEIKTVEEFLSSAQAAYARPEDKMVCANPSVARMLIANIKKVQPTWNVVPYQQELAFYEQEHKRRQLAVATTPEPVAPVAP
jgi:hypothetical protein